MNQSSSISVTPKTVLSSSLFLKGNVRQTDSMKKGKSLNESVFVTLPFKKLWGKLNCFCCAFVPGMHILHILCDVKLNILSISIIKMLDIAVVLHYIHKQPYSLICKTNYIVGKSITTMLSLIYTAWKTENLHLQNYTKWSTIHNVLLFFPNNANQILGYQSMVILLFNVVQNYVNFCFFLTVLMLCHCIIYIHTVLKDNMFLKCCIPSLLLKVLKF